MPVFARNPIALVTPADGVDLIEMGHACVESLRGDLPGVAAPPVPASPVAAVEPPALVAADPEELAPAVACQPGADLRDVAAQISPGPALPADVGAVVAPDAESRAYLIKPIVVRDRTQGRQERAILDHFDRRPE